MIYSTIGMAAIWKSRINNIGKTLVDGWMNNVLFFAGNGVFFNVATAQTPALTQKKQVF